MIILGSRGREKVKSTGQFYCPQCDTFRPYKLKEAGKYFTLYFIPLWQTEKYGEYVECQFCHQTFKPEVLNYKPLSKVDRIVEALKDELSTGTPLHMARQKLINQGLSDDMAEKLVRKAAGSITNTCPKCGFTYAHSVSTCSNCGSQHIDVFGTHI